MTAKSFQSFLGTAPRTYRQLLPEGFAQVAVNCRLTDGTLTPFNKPKLIAPLLSMTATAKTLWRMYSGANEYWLSWAQHVDIVKSPFYADRIYWTGIGPPRQTDLANAIIGTPMPGAWFALGIPAPTTAASLSPSGGAGAATTRAYVYTRVDTWGQESAPSPAVVATGKVDDTWALSSMQADPANSGSVTAATHSSGTVTVTIGSNLFHRVGEEITFASVGGMTSLNGTFKITGLVSTDKVTVALTTAQTYTSGGTWNRTAPFITTGMLKNIYRTINGVYFYVGSTSGSTYNDTASDAVVALNATLPSILWQQPPVDLIGLAVLPNGSLAAISGNTVRFSEPGFPHAWPPLYSVQLSHPGVNLKAIENTLIVATTGKPWIITGSDPLSMGPVPHSATWPCIAARSMTQGEYGVEYASPFGLVVFSTVGGNVITKPLFTEVEWNKIKPETFFSAHHAGRYYTGYVTASEAAVFILQRDEPAALLKTNIAPSAIYACEDNAKLYMVVNNEVYLWDGDEGQRMDFDWMSHEVFTAPPCTFAVAKVDAEFSMTPEEQAAALAAFNAVVAANAAIIVADTYGGSLGDEEFGSMEFGGDALADPPPTNWESIGFHLYVNNVLRFSKQVTNSRAFRMLKYSQSDTVAVRCNGNARVSAIKIAQSGKELETV